MTDVPHLKPTFHWQCFVPARQEMSRRYFKLIFWYSVMLRGNIVENIFQDSWSSVWFMSIS